MNELQILFDTELSVACVNKEKIIKVQPINEDVLYKFIIGIDGIWKTIQDYSQKNECTWIPNWQGKYIVMVQAKKINSKKPFDFMTKSEILVEDVVNDETSIVDIECDDNLNEKESIESVQNIESKNIDNELDKNVSQIQEEYIKDVNINKDKFIIGEKVNINVIGFKDNLLYRFWLNGKQGWEALKDYSKENNFIFTPIFEGKYEILIECKEEKSDEKFDDFTTVNFEVIHKEQKVTIIKFNCLTRKRIVGNELSFKVQTNLDNERTILYKFIKINNFGEKICIQDYSSSQCVTFKESIAGKYKLLCLARDMLSNNEFDDRALMIYDVNPYEKVTLNNVTTDILSPEVNGSKINIKADAVGGRQLLYRFIIEGKVKEDTGFIRSSEYLWTTKLVGDYNITVLVKDVSCNDEYEDKKCITFTVDNSSSTPIRIAQIISKKKCILVGEKTNIQIIAEGGIELQYAFIVYKEKIEQESIDYGPSNWVDFVPEEKGDYEIEVRIKDRFSDKEYDNNCVVKIKVTDFIAAQIDYLIVQNRKNYVVGDDIIVEAIVQNTENTLMKYTMKINGREVEEINYQKEKSINVNPKCAGKYSFTVYCKNIKSDEKYDDKREVSVYVYENKPVINTKISYNIDEIKVNKEVSFYVTSFGGKDVCYEFYIMENGNWMKVQDYSRKNYYTFIPFVKGEHRVMAMAKSFYKNVNYEDYDEMIFEVS